METHVVDEKTGEVFFTRKIILTIDELNVLETLLERKWQILNRQCKTAERNELSRIACKLKNARDYGDIVS